MLRDKEAMATVAVRDFQAATRFYGQTLGLEETGGDEDMGDVTTFRSGSSTIVVYKSEFAATNKATSVTWSVGDEFDAIIAALQKAKVPFEHYDMPGFPRKGDVHQSGAFKAAWFRDPDGNILHVNNA